MIPSNYLPSEIVPKTETRTCKKCKRVLPVFKFKRAGEGYRHVCTDCEQSEKGISDRFKDFTSRELIEELRNRGYKGTLACTKIEQVKI